MFGFAGVGFLGAVDAVGGVEAGAEHFLLALSVTASHGLDNVVETGFLVFLFHCFDGLVFLVKEARIVPNNITVISQEGPYFSGKQVEGLHKASGLDLC